MTDVGCGCGYGSSILGQVAGWVVAYDRDEGALDHAEEYFSAPGISFLHGDVQKHPARFTWGEVAVAFEIIEHLTDPYPLLLAIRSPTLYASVPDERGNPWSEAKFPFHHRHYTLEQFHELLKDTGWRVTEDWFQRDKRPGVMERGVAADGGRTLIIRAERA